MQSFKEILAHLHYLNNPYLTAVGIVCTLFMGFFVLLKNAKSPAYRVFFWMLFTIAVWFFGNMMSMFYFRDLKTAVLWYEIGYSGVCFIAPAYYHFYCAYFKKGNKALLYLFYLSGVPELIYLWFSGKIGIASVSGEADSDSGREPFL